jgi:nucleoside-diphosphate-sugar epimerase
MPISTSNRLFVFGLGYSATVFAERCRARGWRVAGTARESARTAALKVRGIEAHLFDGIRPLADWSAALAGATHILSSIPPGATGDPVLGLHGRDLAAVESVVWVGYLSTTGVYGDRAGGAVDEMSPLLPTSDRARHRVEAERQWLAWQRARGLPVHLFRLAGIYGPGRSALDTVRAGQAKRIDLPGHVFSRIHVDDIATVLEASIARPDPGAVYNVCDDRPAPAEEVIAYACRLLGVAPPPLVSLAAAGLAPMAASFYRDNKRVANGRIKRELGVTLRYPDYRSGLDAILKAAG